MLKKFIAILATLFSGAQGTSHATEPFTNIVVYYISEISDGDAFASPIGFIPAFDQNYIQKIKEKHSPEDFSFISETINGASIVLFWRKSRIEAINFISENEARDFEGFQAFPENDLKVLQKGLNHFPRRN